MNEIQFEKPNTNKFAFVKWDGKTFHIQEVLWNPITEDNEPIRESHLDVEAFALWFKNGWILS